MLKSLMGTLLKSKLTVLCKDMHIFIQSQSKRDACDVDTFNTAFNTEACRLIKSVEAFGRYTYASDKPSANPNPYKKHKGADTLIIELIAMGAESNIKHLVD